MTATRTLISVAVLSAAACAGLLHLYLAELRLRATGGVTVPVVVLARDLDGGDILGTDALAVRNLPDRFVESRHVLQRDLERIVGMRLRHPRLGHETLLWSDLAGIDAEGQQLAELVQPGMRAVAVDLQRQGIERLLQPGDRIDLLCGDGPDRQATADRPAPELQNVMVLAIGTDLGEATGARDADRDGHLTIAVTPDQAHSLAQVARCGALIAALRNPEDVLTASSEPPGDRL